MADQNPSTTESWRAVIGYEGVYDVSDLGRVRRCRSGRILRQNPNGIGYASLDLTRNGISRKFRVHMLVAAAFMGPVPEGCEVNHCNGDKMDPRADNLEYMTHLENIRHARRTGLHNPSRPGAKNGSAKLTDNDVRAIRREVERGQSYACIARARSIGKSTVARVATREDWSHVH